MTPEQMKAEVKDFFNRNPGIEASAPVIVYALLHEIGARLDAGDIQAALHDLENEGEIKDVSREGWEYSHIYKVAHCPRSFCGCEYSCPFDHCPEEGEK